MTCFIKDIRSYSILFETLRAFGAFTGLKVIKDKTEALALGNSGSLWERHLVMNNLCDIIKILGVYFGGDAKNREELNFWKARTFSHRQDIYKLLKPLPSLSLCLEHPLFQSLRIS